MKKIIAVAAAACLMVACVAAGEGVPAQAAATVYTDYLTAGGSESGLMLDPTIVLEPRSFADIPSSPAGIDSVIVTPDSEMNVTLSGETKSLVSVFNTYLRAKFIPVVRLSAATAAAFVNWLEKTYTISDMMAVTDDISVIETLYADDTAFLVNTVYDLTSHPLTDSRYAEWPRIAEANRAGCNVLLYDAGEENLSVAAEYVEAMTKSCWAYAEDKEEAVKAMAAGCYGVVVNRAETASEALAVFEKEGFARAQFIAAHRGITGYCNEQSPTAVAATFNEGATHIEIDLQITADEQLFICHNSTMSMTSNGNGNFPNTTADAIRKYTLSDYTKKYEETFPTLEEVIGLLAKTDVIFILEMKLDEGTERAADALHAIENLKKVMDRHPEMEGRWYAITFYSIWAERMRSIFPEIPVGYLGGGNSYYTQTKPDYPKFWDGQYVTREKMPECMRHVTRKYNVGLDERAHNDDETINPLTNNLWATWLARGYAENSWTFYDLSNFRTKCNVATTDVAEDCAMLAKKILVPETVSKADLAAGKVTLPCMNYNGWVEERECEVIVVSEGEGTAKVLFYLRQNSGDKADVDFGLYSDLADVTVA